MKKNTERILSLALCLSVFGGTFMAVGCSGSKKALKGTALAEALLAKERINRDHLSSSFDFLDARMAEAVEAEPEAKVRSMSARAHAMDDAAKVDESTKGEIIEGSGDTAVYAWKSFQKLVTELHYFQSHFEAGQDRTERIDGGIDFLESKTDIKDKWVDSISYIDYLMQVEESSEIIYERDEHNDNHSVGIRTVNDEVNTTYEYYENQGETWLRTLATPNRRYETSVVQSDGEVTSFVAENDNGYWRFVQLYSSKGESVSLNVIIMTDELAYCFRYHIGEDSIYDYDLKLISPDLQYEIADLNGSEITLYPAALTGIEELRVSQEEQTALGELGTWIGYSKDYQYYSTYAAPHIHTAKGVIKAPKRFYSDLGLETEATPLDENVGYVGGNVQGLWEYVYPELKFEVKGEDVHERFDNLYAALNKYGIAPIYDGTKVSTMAEDVLKLTESFTDHYAWDGVSISTFDGAMAAYEKEKSKYEKYEAMYTEAQKLPTATKQDMVEAKQNAGFPALSFGADAKVEVNNARVSLDGVSATVAKNTVLEKNGEYVLKIALKKNTEELEELIVLENQAADATVTYDGTELKLELDGTFDLPKDVATGNYDLVAYAATADEGIRVSAFKRVLCEGTVNDKTLFDNGMKVFTTVTNEKYLNSVYENTFDLTIEIADKKGTYAYLDVLQVIENMILEHGYLLAGAKMQYYTEGLEGIPVEADSLGAGTYRLEYLAKADGGKVQAYVYCTIVD